MEISNIRQGQSEILIASYTTDAMRCSNKIDFSLKNCFIGVAQMTSLWRVPPHIGNPNSGKVPPRCFQPYGLYSVGIHTFPSCYNGQPMTQASKLFWGTAVPFLHIHRVYPCVLPGSALSVLPIPQFSSEVSRRCSYSVSGVTIWLCLLQPHYHSAGSLSSDTIQPAPHEAHRLSYFSPEQSSSPSVTTMISPGVGVVKCDRMISVSLPLGLHWHYGDMNFACCVTGSIKYIFCFQIIIIPLRTRLSWDSGFH